MGTDGTNRPVIPITGRGDLPELDSTIHQLAQEAALIALKLKVEGIDLHENCSTLDTYKS